MDIPFYRQENDEFCGPAVLQMILAAHGIQATQQELAQEAQTPVNDPDHGTEIADMVRVLASRGLSIDAKEGRSLNELRAALASGAIVLVVYTEQAYGWGHYALVTEVGGTHVHLLDPDQPRGGEPMTHEEFESRWQDPTHTKTRRFAAFITKH